MRWRSAISCSAALFLTPGSPMRAGRRSVLTLQFVGPECWFPQTAEAKRLLLHAHDILCAIARAHCLPDHIHGTVVLVASGLQSLDAPLRTYTLGYGFVLA